VEFFKKLWKNIENQNRKKLIENAAIAIIAGIIILIAGSTLFSGNKQGKSTDRTEKEVLAGNSYQTATVEDSNEKKLISLLSQIQGVGKVDVMITYYTSAEKVPAYDTQKNESSTEEKDSAGGTRSMAQEEFNSTVAYEDSSDGKKPVFLKSIEPEVKGVLVVAEGADSVEVRERITRAVTVVLDIPIHKVEVVQRKK